MSYPPPLPRCILPPSPWFPPLELGGLICRSYSPGEVTSWMFMGLPAEGRGRNNAQNAALEDKLLQSQYD